MGKSKAKPDAQVALLAGVISHAASDMLDIDDADDAESLAHRIINAGFTLSQPEAEGAEFAQMKERIVRLESWAQGKQVSWA